MSIDVFWPMFVRCMELHPANVGMPISLPDEPLSAIRLFMEVYARPLLWYNTCIKFIDNSKAYAEDTDL